MSCNRKVALVDLDNTLVDLQGQMDSDLHEVLGEDVKKISKKTLESVEYLIKNKYNWWAGLQPLPFGMSIVEELRKIGFEIVICSKGPRRVVSAWTQKVQWVQMYVPDANIVLTQDKSCACCRARSKARRCSNCLLLRQLVCRIKPRACRLHVRLLYCLSQMA